jgi:2-dehydro-3-deoxyphosphogluconate aldolase/(4S)-4-hydroxy-2-oxoglutarate aldolase
MMRSEALRAIVSSGVVVTIRVDSAAQAVQTVEAVIGGGIAAVEISAVVPGIEGLLLELKPKLTPGVLLGAGTVLDSETGRTLILAGADFLVSPVCSTSLIHMAHRYDTLFIGGAFTPTEILAAWEQGSDLVKVFPAEQAGGPAYVKAIRGPLPQVLLAPTGGVTLQNAPEYIRAGAAAVCIGSTLVDRSLVREGDYEAIKQRSALLVDSIRAARQKA